MPIVLTSAFLVTARPTEQKIEFLMKQMRLTKEQVELCIQADPSPNQTDYVTWLARWLSKEQIRLPEDAPRLKQDLSAFQTQKRQPGFEGNKDINSYDPASLAEVIERNVMTVVRPKDVEKFKGLKDLNVIAQKGDLLIYRTGNADTLSALSDSTSWCTRHPDTARNYLRGGPSYVVFYKGKPYAQLHYPTGQFMDRRDRPLVETFQERNYGGWGAAAWKFIGKGMWDPVGKEALEIIRAKDPKVDEWIKKNIATSPEELQSLKSRLPYTPENQAKLAIMNGQPLDAEDEAALKGEKPELVEKYASKFHPKGRWEPLERSILTHPMEENIIEYAKERMGGRWPSAEARIMRSVSTSMWVSKLALRYAKEVVGGRWDSLERKIYSSKGNNVIANLAGEYAQEVLKARWASISDVQMSFEFGMARPEYIICKFAPTTALAYASYFGIKPWPELAQILLAEKDINHYINYLAGVGGGMRDPKLEKWLISPEIETINCKVRTEQRRFQINKDSLANDYVSNIVKNRWPEFEKKMISEVLQEGGGGIPSDWQEKEDFDPWANRLVNPFSDYLDDTVKGRWPEFEQALLKRYGMYPDQWKSNQALVDGYLRAILYMEKRDENAPALLLNWPEGKKRLIQRDQGYEAFLTQEANEALERVAPELLNTPTGKRSTWTGLWGFTHDISNYINYIRKHGSDWPEGVELVNHVEDVREEAEGSSAINNRMSSHRLFRGRRIVPLFS